MFYISDSYLDSLIEEDIHIADITTEALKIGDKRGTLECFPKADCVLSGVAETSRIFKRVGCECTVLASNGDRVKAESIFLRVRGTACALHSVYKLAQNIMEYSSGIATRCFALVTNARSVSPDIEVAVTRKHFPGTKRLSLKAAVDGGAMVHRMGLSDSILVFDQHREFTEGTEGFIKILPDITRRFPEKKIMTEANSPKDAVAFALAGAAVVQCERFSCEELAACVPLMRAANPNVIISAAGGINADNAAKYASCALDVLVTSWPYFGNPMDIKMRFHEETE